MHKYRFFDEGSGETLLNMELADKIDDITIDKTIDELEDETGCYVLWEEVK